MKFSGINQFLSEHRYAVFTALLVALIAGLPQIIAHNALGPGDMGIPYLVHDSEGEYLGRIQEILDGYWSVSSPVLYEYKDSISLIPPTGEFIFYVLPMKLFGLSVSTVIFLSRFLYPALLFFFVYLFILSLLNQKDGRARLSAIAGGLLITLGYSATNLRSFTSYITNGATSPLDLLWNRLVNPVSGAILLFAFLWLLSRIVNERGRWLTIVVSAVILSAMPGYIFSFAIALTAPVLIGIYFVWRKNWTGALRVCIPVIIALSINFFYFAGVFLAMKGGDLLSDPRKSGMYFTHEPMVNIISYVALAAGILLFIFYFRKDMSTEKEKRWWFVSIAVMAACVVVYSQQIITGRTVAPQHFVQYTKPLAMAIAVVLLHNIFRVRAKNVWRTAIVAIFIISSISGWRFLSSTKFSIPLYTELQSFSGVFGYLNANAEKDCVVYVSAGYRDEINRFIAAFTSCNVYHSFHIYNGVPAERVMHNFLVNLRLRGVKPEDLEKHFNDNWFYKQAYFFRDWGDMFCCGDRWLKRVGDREEIDRWFASVEEDVGVKYGQYLQGDLYSQLTRYRLDYFVVDMEKQPQVNEKNFPFLYPKGQFGRFAVYAMIKR